MLHDVCRYVPGFSSEAIERATDLDGGAHKKTGHKRSTTTHREEEGGVLVLDG